ncbi:hypothetical protein K9N68_33350 [Kovacikia minuta CCNUW1]|uniref:hypothetical protein n=1 Tax=Kovacikia minuta TaxID=2931930 RepID=UPI001CCC4A79|nr:hypothetical protein [Kovacikia minuta]UBF26332.1 hypothetical protein K9N68_33350 [Kovacikia minuta CCNUW1]
MRFQPISKVEAEQGFQDLCSQISDLCVHGSLPSSGAILGGMQGLRQRLDVASPDQKVELLPQCPNYREAGIDLLVEAVNDTELIVRAKACQLLQGINSPKAQQAIVNGLLLNPGDRVFNVCESVIGYNDWCYDLLQTYEDIEDYGYRLTLISQHIQRSSAEMAARSHHQWRSIQEDECYYLPRIGWDEPNSIRNNFDLVNWCKTHQVLIRLPGESRIDFEQRLNRIGYSIYQTHRLVEEHRLISQELAREEFEEGEPTAHRLGIQKPWNLKLRGTLEDRAIKLLQAGQQYELLGQLWLEAAGRLAFVHEETVTEPTYVKVVENL